MEERTHSFGYWLRRRRKALDLTQEALAQAVSCSRFAIRKIEADERRPSRRLAERLAEKLGIAVNERETFLDAARAVRATERMTVDRVPLANTPAATPFVGRGNEYGLLVGLLAHLTAGVGHVILIEGEPGIGKSRLMHELAQYAGSRDLRTLTTHCYEIERAVPYQPVTDLVAKALDLGSDEALRKLTPVSLAEIAALVPAVAERIAVQALSADFPEARQARLFQAIVQLFDAVAGGQQLVVMIDDIQWADDASAQFIHYLARQAASRPLLLVCAYRDEELDTQEQLGRLVGSLRREGHARHVPLARLKRAEAEPLLAGLGDPELAARLYLESEGNPFFLTSILHAIADGEASTDLPHGVRDSVLARLAYVPAEARATLDVAAVLGRRFDFETLLAVTGEPEEKVLDALEVLVRRRLLREDEDGFHDFSHDKVREVVYRELVGARRMSLHRAVAAALEERAEGEAHERDPQLAEHYERGHMWTKALHYACAAAERSRALFAMRDALHWLDRAVALAESHPEAIEAVSLVDLYARRGAARAQAGQVEGAVADIRHVIDDARTRGDRAKARDAIIQLGMAYRRADNYEQALWCLTEALAESRDMNEERRVADTLYHLGTVMWSDGRNREATTFQQEAVEICERLRLTDLVAVQAYHGRGEAHFSNLEPGSAIACFERSMQLARGIGDKSYQSENLMMIGYACTGIMGLADYPRAEASLEAGLDIARAADLQWHLGPFLLGLDHIRACTGHHDEALRGMAKTLLWLESVKQTRYQLIAHYMIGHLLIATERYQEAVEQSERALSLAARERVTFWRPGIEANRAIARVRLGDLDVLAPLESGLADCRKNSEGHQMARCLEGLAELSLARGDTVRCAAYAEELLALVEPAGAKELVAVGRRLRARAG